MYTVKEIDGVVQRYTLNDLRKDFPHIAFPRNPSAELLSQYDVMIATETPKPYHNTLIEKVVRSFDADGSEVWTVEDLPLETAEANVRAQRETALADTDWYVIKALELNESVSTNVATYRQEWRDITDVVGFPFVDIPTL